MDAVNRLLTDLDLNYSVHEYVQVESVEPPLSPDDCFLGEKIAKADPQVQEQLKLRGVTDLDLVACDTWSGECVLCPHTCSAPWLFPTQKRLFQIQESHPYTGSLNSETPGDSESCSLYQKDDLAQVCSDFVCVSKDLFLHLCIASITISSNIARRRLPGSCVGLAVKHYSDTECC